VLTGRVPDDRTELSTERCLFTPAAWAGSLNIETSELGKLCTELATTFMIAMLASIGLPTYYGISSANFWYCKALHSSTFLERMGRH